MGKCGVLMRLCLKSEENSGLFVFIKFKDALLVKIGWGKKHNIYFPDAFTQPKC